MKILTEASACSVNPMNVFCKQTYVTEDKTLKTKRNFHMEPML